MQFARYKMDVSSVTIDAWKRRLKRTISYSNWMHLDECNKSIICYFLPPPPISVCLSCFRVPLHLCLLFAFSSTHILCVSFFSVSTSFRFYLHCFFVCRRSLLDSSIYSDKTAIESSLINLKISAFAIDWMNVAALKLHFALPTTEECYSIALNQCIAFMRNLIFLCVNQFPSNQLYLFPSLFSIAFRIDK